MMTNVGRLRGWPVSIIEPSLLDAPVALRPVRVRDARAWRDSRRSNASCLRPSEATNPYTPFYLSRHRPLRVARLSRAQPGRVAPPGVAPCPGVPDPHG